MGLHLAQAQGALARGRPTRRCRVVRSVPFVRPLRVKDEPPDVPTTLAEHEGASGLGRSHSARSGRTHSSSEDGGTSSGGSDSELHGAASRAKARARSKLAAPVTRDEEGRILETSSKGVTDEVPIRDHGCAWNVRVISAVAIPVATGKDAGELGQRTLRLIVHQVRASLPPIFSGKVHD